MAVSDHPTPTGQSDSGAGPDAVRALLVDDDDDIRHLVGMYLTRGGGFEVVGEARDGLEGVELAERLQPDVILLDVMMPRMSGHEAIPELLQASPTSMIVMLSALGADANEVPALRAGAFAYIEKTSITLEFGTEVQALLERFRRALGGQTVWIPEYHPRLTDR